MLFMVFLTLGQLKTDMINAFYEVFLASGQLKIDFKNQYDLAVVHGLA